jgi:hypothetical protein
LFIPIICNKNKLKFNKNLEAMTRATRTQLPKWATRAMLSTKMRPNPPLEWGDKLVVGLKEPKATQKNLGPKTFQNFPIELN